MSECYNEGTLRAYLDKELEAAVYASITNHLTGCSTCQHHIHKLRTQSDQVRALLTKPVLPPKPQMAFYRLQQTISTEEEPSTITSLPAASSRRKKMQDKQSFWSGRFRTLIAGIAALVVIGSLLALPPVRAIADQFLQVFRVQKVMFVPVSSDRLAELEKLNFDGKTLFVSEPEVVKKPGDNRNVETMDEAASIVGYAVHQPETFPTTPYSTTFAVQDHGTFRFQVNVESARHLLELMDVKDVTIPDALGNKPITVDLPPAVIAHYRGENYELTLVQGKSPDVTLPDGVDLSQLGKAFLRLLGMDSIQADSLSKDVDWSSTLLFPFPADVDSIRQVTIGNAQGLLTNRNHDQAPNSGKMTKQLYWQDGDHFYVLMSNGRFTNDDVITLAQSVR